MTMEEYKKQHEVLFQGYTQWSEPKFDCPECGGGMRRDNTIVLTSNPVKYLYKCDKCGHVEYLYY